MTEDLEILIPRDCDERHPARFGDADSKRGRCRDGDENRGAENGRFLHHLDRDAAGEKYNATASVDLPAGERAHELVESIVTADILASRDDSFARLPEGGGMDGPGLAIEQLRRRQRRHRGRNFLRRKMKPGPDPTGGARRFTQALDAAQTTSGWPREPATPS